MTTIRKLILATTLATTSIVSANDLSIQVQIFDADTSAPIPARVYLTSDSGTPHYFTSDAPIGTAVKYEKQNWVNEQSVEYHTTISAHPASTKVPPGKYQLVVESGKSYLPFQREVTVSDSSVVVLVELKRWNNPTARGWYSGDTHLHRTIDELKNVSLAEDLNVALPLTNWVTISDKPPATGDRNLNQIPEELVRIDDTHVIWPRNTEYEIFTVGEHRHTLGALFALGHRKALRTTVPPWKPVIENLRLTEPDVLFDLDKLDWPFAMLLPTLAPDALYELANNHVWRTEFAFRKWNTRAATYMHPPQGTGEGGHRQWLDYTHNMYYALLNCGLRLPPAAGTANGVHPVPAGFGRVYVHLPSGFSFRKWMAGLRSGRSFVTTGPMLYATADGMDSGHVFRSATPPSISIELELESERRLSYGELIVNGRPEVLLRPRSKREDDGTFRATLQTKVTPQRSGWFALRFWEPRDDGQSRFVHSAPWYVEIGDEPVRIAAREKQYLIQRMQDEIQRSRDIVSPQATREYEQALGFYQALPELDDEASTRQEARSLTASNRDAWLDNMIMDHRFSPFEIRHATGLSLAEAQTEIDRRAEGRPDIGLRVLPYPGGRHPRTGFLDGALQPQRDTKISVFPPWQNGGYVVVDVPEAIFTNLGLTYLAHTHIPTLWDERGVQLAPTEWTKVDTGLQMQRTLPNKITFTSDVWSSGNGALMKLTLRNGTTQKLTKMRVQVCAMLRAAVGFQTQDPLESVQRGAFVAIRSFESPNRWIITGWKPIHRVWTNPPVPCFHADPTFPDCDPGQEVEANGGIWFYEGNEIQAELRRLESLF